MNARQHAAAMRAHHFDRHFRPFTHSSFLGNADVQRFVPGPTWSYVPLRDRPAHPITGCKCKASYVSGMFHREHCPARQPKEPFRIARGVW